MQFFAMPLITDFNFVLVNHQPGPKQMIGFDFNLKLGLGIDTNVMIYFDFDSQACDLIQV